MGDEPLKLTLYTPSQPVKTSLAEALRRQNVTPEYASDYLILMVSADTPPEHLARAVDCIEAIAPDEGALPYLPPCPPKAMSVREAYLSPREFLPIGQCEGKILAYLPVKCPPAVPAVIAGERLTKEIIAYLEARGYTALAVVKA